MAHKKAGSSSKNGRDSVGQRLGVKVGDGQLVPAGSIIVRQRGMTFLSGPGTGLGKDYTVFATVTGRVKFEHATGYKSADNMRTYDTRTYEGAYMAGVIAGGMTKTNTLGVVGSIPIPEVIRNKPRIICCACFEEPTDQVIINKLSACLMMLSQIDTSVASD